MKTCIQAKIGVCKRDRAVKGQNSFTVGIKKEKRCPRPGRNRRAGHWIWTKVSLFFLQNQLADTDEREQAGPAGRRVKRLLFRGLKEKIDARNLAETSWLVTEIRQRDLVVVEV